jgi:hypothetical protein
MHGRWSLRDETCLCAIYLALLLEHPAEAIFDGRQRLLPEPGDVDRTSIQGR